METKLETFSKQKFCINSHVFHTHTSTCQVLTVKNVFFIVLQLRLSLDYHVFLQEQCLDSLQRFITLNNCKDVSLNIHLETEKSNSGFLCTVIFPVMSWYTWVNKRSAISCHLQRNSNFWNILFKKNSKYI